jgi:uridine kinase
MERSALLDELADRITDVLRGHPIRVGIDGVDGVGKTTLANDLADRIRRRGVPVIRASIDGFHHPRCVRYRRGRTSPEGYFRDSFNYDALTASLLQPLGPGGSLCYQRAVFDYRADTEVDFATEQAPRRSVLLFDGVFLQCEQLRSYWDFTVFLDAPFEVTIPRCAHRDGSSPDVNAPENRRYVEGQELYLQECSPRRGATVVVNLVHLASPEIIDVQSSEAGPLW